MDIKYDEYFGKVEIDLRSPEMREHPENAINQFTGDPQTVVYRGKHIVSVQLHDFGIAVKMDPHDGMWKDAEWAREETWMSIREKLSLIGLRKLMDAAFTRGKKVGIKECQDAMCNALGLPLPGAGAEYWSRHDENA